MKVPEPSCTSTSSPVPPSNGLPSILPAKAIVDAVAVLGLGALALGRERPALLGDALAAASSTSASATSAIEPLELDALEVGELDRRQDLDRDRVGEIGLALDHLLDRVLRPRAA